MSALDPLRVTLLACTSAQAFGFPFFGTYAHALNGVNYFRGANFAYAAGATANTTAFLTPFPPLQVDDFLNFQSKALVGPGLNVCQNQIFLQSIGLCAPIIDAFAEGAYYIPEIAGIDFLYATSALNLSAGVVTATFVPAAAAAVKQAITVSRAIHFPILEMNFQL